MDVNYEITNRAQKELDKAVCYFKLIDKEEEFLSDLILQFNLIVKMPLAFQLRYRQVRIVMLNQFNYSVHYSIHHKTIFILRIINQNQDF